jgi:hypothetical protein
LPMRRASPGVFAERVVQGVDDAGAAEKIVIWIERQPGAVWAVGRCVNPEFPPGNGGAKDYVFQGYELDDALESANGTLTDDLHVSNGDGHAQDVPPFTRDELLKPLERWFFGHR